MLIAWAGYPASMVGVNGAAISNLNPPTLAAVTFGVAQCGLALLLRPLLARLMRRPLAWAVVATANLSAMTLFLWHQSALVVVTAAGAALGRAPGLVTAPAGGAWIVQRLFWLPAFAAVLAVAWLLLHRLEHGRAAGRSARGPRRPRRSPPRPARDRGRGRDGAAPSGVADHVTGPGTAAVHRGAGTVHDVIDAA